MFSALLPGVREFRTPLVTGALWVACLWILVGAKIADSTSTIAFAHRLHLDGLPSTVWLGAGALLVYLIGSLLVVRSSPLTLLSAKIRPRITSIIERLDKNVVPKRARYRPAWRLWRNDRYWRLKSRLRSLGEPRGRPEAVEGWLQNEFQSLMSDGRVPVMRSFRGGCGAPTGFQAFYSTESMRALPDGQPEDFQFELATHFVRQVKDERSAVEARIQMRFPEVYAEIDRLKVEAELRFSIFWPLLILIVLLGFSWSPVALLLLLMPGFLLRDGFERMRQASEKTWGALVAREVSSPTLDAMESAKSEECRSFNTFYGSPEPSLAEVGPLVEAGPSPQLVSNN